MKKWKTLEDGQRWLLEEVNNSNLFIRNMSSFEAQVVFRFFFESYAIQVHSMRVSFSIDEAIRYTQMEICQNTGENFYLTTEIRARALSVLERGFKYYRFPLARCRWNLKRLYEEKSRSMF